MYLSPCRELQGICACLTSLSVNVSSPQRGLVAPTAHADSSVALSGVVCEYIVSTRMSDPVLNKSRLRLEHGQLVEYLHEMYLIPPDRDSTTIQTILYFSPSPAWKTGAHTAHLR